VSVESVAFEHGFDVNDVEENVEQHAESSCDEDEACPVAHGEALETRFLSLKDCASYLCSDISGLECIPNGVKENTWFKVDGLII